MVAVKGLGGYHLACDATDDAAVRRLRDRKRRWAKPFAVMVRDLDAARAPVPRRAAGAPASRGTGPPDRAARGAAGRQARARAVRRRRGPAPRRLPALHAAPPPAAPGRGPPIVLTSGNLTDEPLATDDADALARLAGLADGFLAHDRDIRARYDDSVTRVVARRESVVRRGRGYAPEPLPLPIATPVPLLAVGAELKHTFTLARGGRAPRRAAQRRPRGPRDPPRVHGRPRAPLAAARPGARGGRARPPPRVPVHAVRRGALPGRQRIAVQHHHAHVASCAAEHGITDPFLGVAYDGLGMGDDGTFWGGEILLADLRRLPARGAVRAGADARRRARGQEAVPDGAGLPAGRGGGRRRRGHGRHGRTGPLPRSWPAWTRARSALVRTQVARALNAPVASSAGRLFDAVASLLGPARRGRVRGAGGHRPGAGGRAIVRARSSRTGWRAWTG